MQRRKRVRSDKYILAEWKKDGRLRRWRFYVRQRKFTTKARFEKDTQIVYLPITQDGRIQDLESEIYALLQEYVALMGGDGDSLRIRLFSQG